MLSQLEVLNQAALEKTKPPDVPYAIISITTPGQPLPSINHQNDLLLGVLRLQFDDADKRDPVLLYTSKMSFEVALFIKEIQKKGAVRLLIHSDLGKSRSVAIGQALAEHLPIEFNKKSSNNLVFQETLRALRVVATLDGER